MQFYNTFIGGFRSQVSKGKDVKLFKNHCCELQRFSFEKVLIFKVFVGLGQIS